MPEVFLNNCKRYSHLPACGDDRSGVLTFADMKMRVILLAEYISSFARGIYWNFASVFGRDGLACLSRTTSWQSSTYDQLDCGSASS